MTESAAVMAFAMGVLSAISLPLGAFTATRFQFTDRVVAFLMAFGGGALLAALTLDLVAHGIQSGHFLALGAGWVLGGLLFAVLNNAINDLGGFARKVSTTMHQLRRQERRQFRQFLSGLRRIDIFSDLPARDYEALRAALQRQRYPKGTYIFRRGDPPVFLYLIDHGEVELSQPGHESQRLDRKDVMGRLSFVTGAPSVSDALAVSDCTVLKLPRQVFLSLLSSSPEMIQALHRWLRSDEVFNYLNSRQGLDESMVESWLAHATSRLYANGTLPPAVVVERAEARFMELAQRSAQGGLFGGLPEAEVELVADRLFHRCYQKGHTFYHQGELADRLFIVDGGEVAVVDGGERARQPQYLQPFEVFGPLSFLTGMPRTKTAVATQGTRVWVLLRSDLDELLRRAPTFLARVQSLLADHTLENYLTARHRFSSANALKWMQRANRYLRDGRPLPSAGELTAQLPDQHGAPLAIWLGILLDGVPEALVIGASMVHAQLGASLLGGLFIANYPEALSSSAGMREKGYSLARIYLMWGSLVILTGALAAVGNIFFTDAPPVLFTFIQGVAAGAMLTMIAQTMLPEAYLRGGSVVGVATLLGFLAAIVLKSFE